MIIWKDVVGYEGIYEVSNTGLVRPHEDRIIYSSKRTPWKCKQRNLKQSVFKDNSCRVNLYKDGKSRMWLIHRLVAFAFIPLVEGKEEVNHIDGSRLNNHVSNLEWCNHLENMRHAFNTGLIKTSKKIELHNKKTNEIHSFESMGEASEFLGFKRNYIRVRMSRGTPETKDYHIKVVS